MYVLKRNGQPEAVHFDKITRRLETLLALPGSKPLDTNFVDITRVAQKVCAGVIKGITTVALDELAAQEAAGLIPDHPHYGLLAARICTSNLHKETKPSWVDVCRDLYHYVNPKTKLQAPLLSAAVWDVVQRHGEVLERAIKYERDYKFDYFATVTLMKSYLHKLDGRIVERPQHMFMRVAVEMHRDDVTAVLETYELMSTLQFIHASPTMFNSGAPRAQLSSCFLLQMQSDSIEGIYETLKQCAQISKGAGGVGLAVHKVRAKGSYIAGTNGTSNGLIPMLRVFNNTARYVDQGGGKRKGAFSAYVEPWHADIMSFLSLRLNHGNEEERTRDLFIALWVPDLFMQRVEADETWTLFCPHEAPGLHECHGEAFAELYTRYEAEKRGRETIQARAVWAAIIASQTETGMPYMLYKDAANAKSNQKHLGTIQCSNLCTEIIEYTAPDEIAVCNLASISLPACVDGRTFDFAHLRKLAGVVTRNLNRVIDVTCYPLPEARRSNLRHRPIGIGVQGLADTFNKLRLAFDSPEARQLNKDIFETIYFGALSASIVLAKTEGPYETYPGSPMSQGQLQFDMWNVVPSARWPWAELRAELAQWGARNSLLVAPMPTATTSQILGNVECFEPYTSNLYVRRTLAGEFVCVNTHLREELEAEGLWTPGLKEAIVRGNGSVQHIDTIPAAIRARYKTVWEIKGKHILNMAIDRAPFICQSQSLNAHIARPTYNSVTSLHFHAWKGGLKTGLYYLRSQAAVEAAQVTIPVVATALEPQQGETKEEHMRAGGDASAALRRAAAAPPQQHDMAAQIAALQRLPAVLKADNNDDTPADVLATAIRSCRRGDAECVSCGS